MPAKQKLLITGTCGFIFSNFVRKAIHDKSPYELISIDRVENSLFRNIYSNTNHTFHMADIRDEHIINNLFEYHRPDYVIHGAASSHVDRSLKDPNEFIGNNVLGTQVIINACVKWKVKKLVMISTDECYGSLSSENDLPWDENSLTDPRNPYSASKLSSELLVKAAHNSFGLTYNITRSSNNYGPRQTADKFIPRTIKSIYSGEPIIVYGQGAQIRDWIYVNDNCDAIMTVLEKGKNNEIYNISANCEVSNIELVQKLCNLIGKGHDLIKFVEDRPGHDFRYALKTDKIKALGWAPKYSFSDGLRETENWYAINKWWFRSLDN